MQYSDSDERPMPVRLKRVLGDTCPWKVVKGHKWIAQYKSELEAFAFAEGYEAGLGTPSQCFPPRK